MGLFGPYREAPKETKMRPLDERLGDLIVASDDKAFYCRYENKKFCGFIQVMGEKIRAESDTLPMLVDEMEKQLAASIERSIGDKQALLSRLRQR